MFLPSVILQLAVVVFLPITTTAHFTTSLLTPNTEPTLKLRDQNQDLNTTATPMGPKPSPTNTLVAPPDTVLAREFGYATPSFIATDCKNFKYHNKVPPNPDWFPADGQGGPRRHSIRQDRPEPVQVQVNAVAPGHARDRAEGVWTGVLRHEDQHQHLLV